MNELHFIQLKALLEHSADFMGLVGMDGYVKYINKAGRELLGLHPTDDLSHIQSTDFYSKEGYEHLLEEIVPVIIKEGKWSGRMSFTHFQTKEVIPCYTNYLLIYDPETKEPIARGITLHDLRPELAAQEAKQRLITLVDNSVELMSILEMDGKNSYINKAGMDLLGFETVQEVADTPITQLHTPEDFAFVQANVLPVVMKEGRWDGTMNVRHLKTGEIFPVQNNCIRIDDAITGEPLCVGAVMRDLRPELKARQAYIEEQKKLQQQKDDFLAIVSHELKTPVTSIKAYCQVLQRMLQKNDLQQEAAMMAKMDKQINRLTHLIGDLLDVTKINAGKLQFNDKWFHFNSMVQEVVEDLQRTTDQHTIILNRHPVGQVFGDQERIGQVITNFITNAIKYSPQSDKIIIDVQLADEEVILSVQDFGIGIAADKKDRVFEQFYRVTEDKATFSGLGLGLYISAQIIEREGGRIWVESEEGKGATFSFALPVRKELGV